jgi:hypothetical protein
MSNRYRPMPTGRIVGDMVGDGIASSPVPVKPPIPPLLPRNVRRHQGKDTVSVYCRTCGERTLRTDSGVCLWCLQPFGKNR